MENNNMNMENKVKTVKTKNVVIVCVVCFLILIIVVLSTIIVNLNKPLKRFEDSLELEQIDNLSGIYAEMETFEERKEAEDMLQRKLEKIVMEYAEETINYEVASGELQKYSNMQELNKFYRQNVEALSILKKSKENFVKAEEAELDGNYIEAIKMYNLIVKDDEKNHKVAQEKLVELKITLKSEILTKVETFINNNDFISANNVLNEVKDILKDDDELHNKQEEIAPKVLEQQKKKAKENQELSIVSAKIVEQHSKYKSLYPDMIQVIVQNNTQKVVKSYTVSVLGYDKNGLPVKIEGQFDFSGGVYEFHGRAEDANITAGKRGGTGRGWTLDSNHNVYKVLALVTTVKYYDGTEWENPYYEYWVEEYKEKPLISQ